jgi:Cu(I)/Ag(I) efflux system membrane fusion protein
MTENSQPAPRHRGAAAFLVLGLVMGLAAGTALAWRYGSDLAAVLGIGSPQSASGEPGAAGTAAPGSAAAPAREREILYWYDPMSPGTRFDQPGKSPFMDMDLVPRYADEGGGAGGVVIDPVQVQNLGLKTAPVRRGSLTVVREIAGNVEFNLYQQARVQPRAEGFVSSVESLAVGDLVEAGDPIASITVPAWASDQSEYLLLKSQGAHPRILNGVREKLRLSGMPEDMLEAVESGGRVQTTNRILAPIAGVITELMVYPGMNVDKAMTLAVIQGLDPVWVTAEVPQRDLALAGAGRARVTAAAWPGLVFDISGQTLLPQANPGTRTVPLRLTVPNARGLLRPGMTASIRLRSPAAESLIIPTQSLIDFGDEARVITRNPDGSFLPKAVRAGASSRGETAILEGLEEGDEVVVSGLFLIDSEANLAGALDRLRRPSEPAPEAVPAGAPAPSGAPATAPAAAPAAHDHGAPPAAPPASAAHDHGAGQG